MTRLKAIIVDDERLARVNLIKLLESVQEIEIVGEADSCKTALEVIGEQKPQLIFLDIQLCGETGFDLLEMIKHSIKVIFVTAFDEYAIRAFEVNAVDYLLKPVNIDRLKESVGRIVKKENDQKSIAKHYEYTDSIYVWLNNYTSKFIKISSISYIEPIGNYSKIVTMEGNHCLVLKTLKQWQQELPLNNFIRIHRSRIINVEHIDRIERHSNTHHKAFLKNKTEPLEVSRRFSGNLKSL
ncbi:MAG: LytTR family DNA-binding domain-containing protein [Bacteroidales bacterium]|nr:LytTR family DNA-binding domain-containing protein [Bacteroidales bacterium]